MEEINKLVQNAIVSRAKVEPANCGKYILTET